MMLSPVEGEEGGSTTGTHPPVTKGDSKETKEERGETQEPATWQD